MSICGTLVEVWPSSAVGLVASAGYLGAAIVGCLLMAATRDERRAHVIIRGIGACMLLTLVFWMRNLFGFAVVLAWGIALILLARRQMGWFRRDPRVRWFEAGEGGAPGVVDDVAAYLEAA